MGSIASCRWNIRRQSLLRACTKAPALRRGLFSGRGSVARFYLNQRLVRNRRHGLALTTQAGRRVRSGDTQLRLRVAVRIGFHPLQASGVDDVVQGLGLGGRRCRRDDDGLLGYHRGRSGGGSRAAATARPERALVLPVRQLASPRVRQRALRPAWQQAQQRAWWRPAPRPRGRGLVARLRLRDHGLDGSCLNRLGLDGLLDCRSGFGLSGFGGRGACG